MASKNKNYYHDKERNVFVCVCHNKDFLTMNEVYKHCKAIRKLRGEESPYDLHYSRRCSKNSRICRYCYPEPEIGFVESKASREYPGGDIHTTITTLLSLEQRYRHKFSEKHLEDISRAFKRGMLQRMIRGRLEKRLRVKLKNDGSQTPYLAHGIDVGTHTMAICCRRCINKWYKFPEDRDLTDEEIDYLVDALSTYLTEYINAPGPVREFMTQKPLNEQGYFYEPGEYLVTKDSVQKIGDAIVVARDEV